MRYFKGLHFQTCVLQLLSIKYLHVENEATTTF